MACEGGRPKFSDRRLLLVLVVGLLAGCLPAERAVVLHSEGKPSRLSDWQLFEVRGGYLELNERVIPYDLTTSLFSDYAHKLRTVWMPIDAAVTHRPQAWASPHGDLELPLGTILSKTFYYPLASGSSGAEPIGVERREQVGLALEEAGLPLAGLRLLETRLLVRREEGWVALPYVWNEKQTDAVLEVVGQTLDLELVDADGDTEPVAYLVPDTNQCAGCHATNHDDRRLRPIGPKLRLLNRDLAYPDGGRSQIRHWQASGYLPQLDPDRLPFAAAAADPESGDLDARARAYLDVNCGHCHNPEGPADTSGLFLDPATHDRRRLGLCKPPIAAGRGSGDRLVSIDPGHPERSILVYRMASTDPGIAMPELGRSTVDRQGVALVSEWIASLDGDCRPVLEGRALASQMTGSPVKRENRPEGERGP